jgi:nicotine blue oxidoreductase
MRIAAVVLAAGEATRFGAPKQQLLVPLVLERLRAGPVDEIVVVEGAHPLNLPSDTSSLGIPARRVRCDDWSGGTGASLRCGLRALDDDVEAAVVVLGDGPHLSPLAVERVLGVWLEERGIVAASYEGHRGHPLVLGRDRWSDVPDEGLHSLPVRLVPCDDLGAPGDVDRPEDLGKTGIRSRRLRSREDP